MPKLIDWGVRNDLVREAVIRVAAREGVGGVSYASVAAEMRVSESTLRRTVVTPGLLPYMGVSLLVRLRMHRRHLRSRPAGCDYGSLEHVVWLLACELPRDQEELEEQRAWRELTGTGASEACVELGREYGEFLEALVHDVLATLGTEEATRALHAIRLRALLDGLVAARCREAVSAEDAVACVEACLRELAPEPADRLSPDAA